QMGATGVTDNAKTPGNPGVSSFDLPYPSSSGSRPPSKSREKAPGAPSGVAQSLVETGTAAAPRRRAWSIAAPRNGPPASGGASGVRATGSPLATSPTTPPAHGPPTGVASCAGGRLVAPPSRATAGPRAAKVSPFPPELTPARDGWDWG